MSPQDRKIFVNNPKALEWKGTGLKFHAFVARQLHGVGTIFLQEFQSEKRNESKTQPRMSKDRVAQLITKAGGIREIKSVDKK